MGTDRLTPSDGSPPAVVGPAACDRGYVAKALGARRPEHVSGSHVGLAFNRKTYRAIAHALAAAEAAQLAD